jgi:hypothetical protein
VPVHEVILANAEGIDDAMLVVANVMFEDMLKFPATTPDMLRQAEASIFTAGAPLMPDMSRNPAGIIAVTPVMLKQAY